MSPLEKARAARAQPEITEGTKAQAREMFMQGASMTDIAKALEITKATVSAWCTREGWRQTRAAIEHENGSAVPELCNPDQSHRMSGDYAETKAVATIDLLPDLTKRKEMLAYLAELRRKPEEEQREGFKASMRWVALKFPLMLQMMPEADLVNKADKLAKLYEMCRSALGFVDQAAGGNTLIQIGLNTSPKAVSPVEITTDSPPET